jgi:hypothetical protein
MQQELSTGNSAFMTTIMLSVLYREQLRIDLWRLSERARVGRHTSLSDSETRRVSR